MLSKKFKEINFKELYRILLIADLLPALKGEFPEVSRVTPLLWYSIIPQADQEKSAPDPHVLRVDRPGVLFYYTC